MRQVVAMRRVILAIGFLERTNHTRSLRSGQMPIGCSWHGGDFPIKFDKKLTFLQQLSDNWEGTEEV
jgi:hypothetical protein